MDLLTATTTVTSASQVAVVGDRLFTDVMMANLMGAWGVWVRDGVVDARGSFVGFPPGGYADVRAVANSWGAVLEGGGRGGCCSGKVGGERPIAGRRDLAAAVMWEQKRIS